MTAAQQARTEGFLTSLSARGVSLEILPDGDEVTALVERVDPDQGEFAVARETAAGARIHVLRTHLANLEIGVGSVLRDGVAQATYRVAAIDDNPANIAVVMSCEAAGDPTP